MDSGLIQFLVVAVFVIISMMDGAARKRRKQAESLGQLPTPDGVPDTADELRQADGPSGESEGMVPQDLWKEIAALARGEVPASQQEQLAHGDPSSADDPDSQLEAWTALDQDVSAKTSLADLQAGYKHPDQALIHREHAQVASPAQTVPEEPPHEFVLHPPEQPSEAQTVPEEPPHEFVRHLPERLSEAQTELRPTQKLQAKKPRGVLSEVRLGTRSSLRDAIIVAEVLGPPVTLRDLGWKPLF